MQSIEHDEKNHHKLTPLSGYQFLLSKKMQNQNRARVEYRKRLKDRAMASLAKNQKLQDDLGTE